MSGQSRYGWSAVAVTAFVLYALTIPSVYQQPREQAASEMRVALPRFVQVLMSGGDRYLAADIAGFRALVASTENMKQEDYRIQGIVQSDVAWLNPAHEDNYYIAAAVLSWNEQVEAAQFVLRAATEARPFDWLPPFYLGFNALHFQKQPVKGANWLRVAAQHTNDEAMRIGFQQMAAQWVAKGDDLEIAINMHRAMARDTKHKAFAAFLEKRAVRLENLRDLERAIDRYRQRFDRMPDVVQDLVDKGVMTSLPIDPFGLVYVMDTSGRPQVVTHTASSLSGGRKASKQ